MRAAFPLLLVLPFLSQVAAAPLIVALVADLPGTNDGEEGIAVASRGMFDLSGHVLDDGEDAFVFPPGTMMQANATFWTVANASTWERFDGPAPNLAGLTLRLGNGGDDVCLSTPAGQPIDCFAYGDGAARGVDKALSATSPGLVYTRAVDADDWVDTDSADDWRTPRPHRIGESNLDRPTFEVSQLTLYASPDSSFETLTGLIAAARDRLHLHVYELRSASLADALVAAKLTNPRIDLQVLVDASPVGLQLSDRHEEADALRRIEDAGGESWLADADRYDHHHLKVLVADDAVAIQSENWVASGVPANPSWGNRGWGVVVHDAEVADWFATWMAEDRAAWDTRPFDLATFDRTFVEPARTAPRIGDHRPVPAVTLDGAFRVTPIVAPDHTQVPAMDAIALAVAGARQRLDVQQLDLALRGSNVLGWRGNDALAAAIVRASHEGAHVRVQLAAPFSADDLGNEEALDWLAGQGIDGKMAGGNFATLHNKGIIADEAAIVGSINGNHHSRSDNREVSVLLEGAGIADYYGALFDGDWKGRDPGRDWGVPAGDLRALPATLYPTLLALTWLTLLLRGRR